VPRTGYQIDAFVAGWKVKPSAEVGRHIAECPDVPKFSLIFRRSLQIELREAFKHGTFFAIRRKALGSLPKVVPRGA
jgi:hypothetical protein